MGFRFRKSIKVAPGVKVNLNKKSIGATVGTKGAHYTVNSKGKKTTTVGVPGTGFSYTSSSGSSKKRKKGSSSSGSRNINNTSSNGEHPSNNNKKKWYQKTGWIIFWLIVFFPVGLFLVWRYAKWNKIIKIIITAFFLIAFVGMVSSPDLESLILHADTSKVYDINEKVTIELKTKPTEYSIPDDAFITSGGKLSVSGNEITFSSDKPGAYKIYAKHSGVKSNALIIKVKDMAASTEEQTAETVEEEAAAQQAEEEAAAQQAEQEQIAAEAAAEQQAAEQVQQEQEPMVWISQTGSKYHSNANCSNMSNPSQIPLSQAQASGYEPCKKCY